MLQTSNSLSCSMFDATTKEFRSWQRDFVWCLESTSELRTSIFAKAIPATLAILRIHGLHRYRRSNHHNSHRILYCLQVAIHHKHEVPIQPHPSPVPPVMAAQSCCGWAPNGHFCASRAVASEQDPNVRWFHRGCQEDISHLYGNREWPAQFSTQPSMFGHCRSVSRRCWLHNHDNLCP